MKKITPELIKRESGVTTVETAMLLPWLFILIFGITQLTLYLYTRNVVHYAAFMAARSAVVYGKKTLGEIGYPYVGGGNETNSGQTIAQAIAEKLIFESLPWESSRIKELKPQSYIDRVYTNNAGDRGAVSLKFAEISDEQVTVELTYCMPVHFGIYNYFVTDTLTHRCKNVVSPKTGNTIASVEILEKVSLRSYQ